MLVTFFGMARQAHGCSVPVFRYALERWRPALYTAWVLHPGPLPSPYIEAISALDSFCQTNSINLAVHSIDSTQPLPGELEPQRAICAGVKAGNPLLIVQFPKRLNLSAPLYSGPITGGVLHSLIFSESRRQLAERLGRGDSAIFVVLENDDATDSQALVARAEAQAKYLQSVLKLHALDKDDPSSKLHSDLPLKITFSVLRVNRNDPAEKMFAAMIMKGQELKENIAGEPIVALVFGQGHLFDARASSELKPDTFDEWGRFACGPCMCQIKESNPGMDLLTAIDWESILDRQTPAAPAQVLPDFRRLLKEAGEGK